jgi:hypothetical protein
MRPLHSAFVSQMAGVVLLCIGGGVVAGGLQPSGCVWVLGCVARGSEGPGEQIGSEGGTAGVPGRSPLVCSCSPVVIRHTSHPSFEGRRVVVVGLPLGCCLACLGAAQPQNLLFFLSCRQRMGVQQSSLPMLMWWEDGFGS